MDKIYRVQFIWDFLRKNKVDNCFKSICYNNKIIIENLFVNKKTPKVIYISLFPTFLDHRIENENEYNLKRINHLNFSGAGIILNNDTKLKKTKSKLDKSFDIVYEYNYGKITTEKCDFLLKALYNMLKRRFDQKNEQNNYFLFWDDYTKNIKTSINQKKASLFVVYANNKPISIALNYHIADSIMHGEINAYDIDYSKYGIGHLCNKLLINWCINNKYKYLDLGNGIINYKKHICNSFYDFEYLIYYKKKSIIAKILAYKEILIIYSKNLIKHLALKITTIKNSIYKKKVIAPLLEYKIEDLNKNESITNLTRININHENNSYIRKPIYDFLYTHNKHIKEIEIYKMSSNNNCFLIKENNNVFQLELKK